MQAALDGTAAHSMNAVSILFAYLLAMYFTGKSLSRFQVAAVTVIYSTFLLFPVLSVSGGFLNVVNLSMEFLREHPGVATTYRASEAASNLYTFRIGILSVFFFAWLLSVLFMFSIRKDK
jgi:hypothetical protein